jgi:hypothetical protein
MSGNFKRYECGCVEFVLNGMPIGPGAKQVWRFKSCVLHGSYDEPRLALFQHRAMQGTPSRQLTDNETDALFVELSMLVADGYELRGLRGTLRSFLRMEP